MHRISELLKLFESADVVILRRYHLPEKEDPTRYTNQVTGKVQRFMDIGQIALGGCSYDDIPLDDDYDTILDAIISYDRNVKEGDETKAEKAERRAKKDERKTYAKKAKKRLAGLEMDN